MTLHPRPLAPAAAALALAALGGCQRAPSDDVRARLDGAYLVLENRTRADIHHRVVARPEDAASAPVSQPGNRLEPGRFMRWRIAPSQRGQVVDLQWWRPGGDVDAAGPRGADRVRTIAVALDEPDPVPVDELAVRACIAAHRAQGRLRADTERRCMDGAEHCLTTSPAGCAPLVHGWRQVEAEARAQRQRGGS